MTDRQNSPNVADQAETMPDRVIAAELKTLASVKESEAANG